MKKHHNLIGSCENSREFEFVNETLGGRGSVTIFGKVEKKISNLFGSYPKLVIEENLVRLYNNDHGGEKNFGCKVGKKNSNGGLHMEENKGNEKRH